MSQSVIFQMKVRHWAPPHLTSPHLTLPYLTSPHLTSPHLTSPHLTSPHLTSPHPTSPHLTPPPRLAYQVHPRAAARHSLTHARRTRDWQIEICVVCSCSDSKRSCAFTVFAFQTSSRIGDAGLLVTPCAMWAAVVA
jgi:hypothetical protein